MSMENNAPSLTSLGKRTKKLRHFITDPDPRGGGCLARYLLYARYYEHRRCLRQRKSGHPDTANHRYRDSGDRG